MTETQAVVEVQICVPRSQRDEAVKTVESIRGVDIIDVRTEPEHQVDSFITARFVPIVVIDPFTTLIELSQVGRYLSVDLRTIEVA